MDLKEIMREITEKSGAKIVFGEAYVKDRVTFIPVAKVSIHACGCGRAEPAGKERVEKAAGKKKGPCMGVGVKTVPLGYIEIRQGKARFVEIVDRSKLMHTALIVGGVGLFLLARMALKKRN
ncbi:MAG: hypothetical protein NTW95_05030 [Candidatus Aminicenantes bacterium]|nr:hypothetical protein [Candidatus Aminicenantes bacterium]